MTDEKQENKPAEVETEVKTDVSHQGVDPKPELTDQSSAAIELAAVEAQSNEGPTASGGDTAVKADTDPGFDPAAASQDNIDPVIERQRAIHKALPRSVDVLMAELGVCGVFTDSIDTLLAQVAHNWETGMMIVDMYAHNGDSDDHIDRVAINPTKIIAIMKEHDGDTLFDAWLARYERDNRPQQPEGLAAMMSAMASGADTKVGAMPFTTKPGFDDDEGNGSPTIN